MFKTFPFWVVIGKVLARNRRKNASQNFLGVGLTPPYRMIYAVQIGEKIYVLHAFQKKSKTGIKTPKSDVDLVKQRYKQAQELAKDDDAEN